MAPMARLENRPQEAFAQALNFYKTDWRIER